MRCCYTGCTKTTLRESYKFCSQHWEDFAKQYGKANTYPDWLKALISMTRAEVYAERRDSRSMVSLDKLIESGARELDDATMYRGTERKRKVTKKLGEGGNTDGRRSKQNVADTK